MDYVNIAFGVIVSVTLFVISYRKIIGAKKERVNATYHEIVKILIRNLINNDHILSIPEINRILQTKSLENRIKVTDLPDEITFIYALYTRITENEILSSEKRKELIQGINEYLKKVEEKEPSVLIEEEKKPVVKEEKISFLLGLTSIFVATLATIFVFYPYRLISTSSLINILMSVVAMTAALITIITFIRLKEEQEEPIVSRKSTIKAYKEFEDRILKIIGASGKTMREFVLKKDNRTFVFDICFKRGTKTFLIEVKRFRSYVPRFVIDKLKDRARIAKEIDKNYVLILVVENKKYLARYLDDLSKTWDYIFDEDELKEFRNKLIHNI